VDNKCSSEKWSLYLLKKYWADRDVSGDVIQNYIYSNFIQELLILKGNPNR
jgi:hypothetical protein